MMEGEKMGSHKKEFLELNCLSPLKMLTSPLFEETFDAFLFFLFSLSLSLLSSSLEDLGVSMIFEEKIPSLKTSFQISLIYWWWMHIP
jgi:hypothetical protein